MVILSAPEIRGAVCPFCGGCLLRHRKRAWCDDCERYVKPQREKP